MLTVSVQYNVVHKNFILLHSNSLPSGTKRRHKRLAGGGKKGAKEGERGKRKKNREKEKKEKKGSKGRSKSELFPPF